MNTPSSPKHFSGPWSFTVSKGGLLVIVGDGMRIELLLSNPEIGGELAHELSAALPSIMARAQANVAADLKAIGHD